MDGILTSPCVVQTNARETHTETTVVHIDSS